MSDPDATGTEADHQMTNQHAIVAQFTADLLDITTGGEAPSDDAERTDSDLAKLQDASPEAGATEHNVEGIESYASTNGTDLASVQETVSDKKDDSEPAVSPFEPDSVDVSATQLEDAKLMSDAEKDATSDGSALHSLIQVSPHDEAAPNVSDDVLSARIPTVDPSSMLESDVIPSSVPETSSLGPEPQAGPSPSAEEYTAAESLPDDKEFGVSSNAPAAEEEGHTAVITKEEDVHAPPTVITDAEIPLEKDVMAETQVPDNQFTVDDSIVATETTLIDPSPAEDTREETTLAETPELADPSVVHEVPSDSINSTAEVAQEQGDQGQVEHLNESITGSFNQPNDAEMLVDSTSSVDAGISTPVIEIPSTSFEANPSAEIAHEDHTEQLVTVGGEGFDTDTETAAEEPSIDTDASRLAAAGEQQIERPKSPWTPSYSVTTQGPGFSPSDEAEIAELLALPPSVDAPGPEDHSDLPSAIQAEPAVTVTGAEDEESQTPPSSDSSRPWTPSYSVVVQGSPLSAPVALEEEVSTAEVDPAEPSPIVTTQALEISASVAEPTVTVTGTEDDEAQAPPSSDSSRPWTPSYSVVVQGSPLSPPVDLHEEEETAVAAVDVDAQPSPFQNEEHESNQEIVDPNPQMTSLIESGVVVDPSTLHDPDVEDAPGPDPASEAVVAALIESGVLADSDDTFPVHPDLPVPTPPIPEAVNEETTLSAVSDSEDPLTLAPTEEIPVDVTVSGQELPLPESEDVALAPEVESVPASEDYTIDPKPTIEIETFLTTAQSGPERPRSPWTPSYSVTTQGWIPSEDTPAPSEPEKSPEQEDFIEPVADVPTLEAPLDPPRPWTPSYSVSRQGSPLPIAAEQLMDVQPASTAEEVVASPEGVTDPNFHQATDDVGTDSIADSLPTLEVSDTANTGEEPASNRAQAEAATGEVSDHIPDSATPPEITGQSLQVADVPVQESSLGDSSLDAALLEPTAALTETGVTPVDDIDTGVAAEPIAEEIASAGDIQSTPPVDETSIDIVTETPVVDEVKTVLPDSAPETESIIAEPESVPDVVVADSRLEPEQEPLFESGEVPVTDNDEGAVLEASTQIVDVAEEVDAAETTETPESVLDVGAVDASPSSFAAAPSAGIDPVEDFVEDTSAFIGASDGPFDIIPTEVDNASDPELPTTTVNIARKSNEPEEVSESGISVHQELSEEREVIPLPPHEENTADKTDVLKSLPPATELIDEPTLSAAETTAPHELAQEEVADLSPPEDEAETSPRPVELASIEEPVEATLAGEPILDVSSVAPAVEELSESQVAVENPITTSDSLAIEAPVTEVALAEPSTDEAPVTATAAPEESSEEIAPLSQHSEIVVEEIATSDFLAPAVEAPVSEIPAAAEPSVDEALVAANAAPEAFSEASPPSEVAVEETPTVELAPAAEAPVAEPVVTVEPTADEAPIAVPAAAEPSVDEVLVAANAAPEEPSEEITQLSPPSEVTVEEAPAVEFASSAEAPVAEPVVTVEPTADEAPIPVPAAAEPSADEALVAANVAPEESSEEITQSSPPSEVPIEEAPAAEGAVAEVVVTVEPTADEAPIAAFIPEDPEPLEEDLAHSSPPSEAAVEDPITISDSNPPAVEPPVAEISGIELVAESTADEEPIAELTAPAESPEPQEDIAPEPIHAVQPPPLVDEVGDGELTVVATELKDEPIPAAEDIVAVTPVEESAESPAAEAAPDLPAEEVAGPAAADSEAVGSRLAPTVDEARPCSVPEAVAVDSADPAPQESAQSASGPVQEVAAIATLETVAEPFGDKGVISDPVPTISIENPDDDSPQTESNEITTIVPPVEPVVETVADAVPVVEATTDLPTAEDPSNDSTVAPVEDQLEPVVESVVDAVPAMEAATDSSTAEAASNEPILYIDDQPVVDSVAHADVVPAVDNAPVALESEFVHPAPQVEDVAVSSVSKSATTLDASPEKVESSTVVTLHSLVDEVPSQVAGDDEDRGTDTPVPPAADTTNEATPVSAVVPLPSEPQSFPLMVDVSESADPSDDGRSSLHAPISPRSRLESTASSMFFPGGWFSKIPEGRASLDVAQGEITSPKLNSPPVSTPTDAAPADETEQTEEKKGKWCVVM